MNRAIKKLSNLPLFHKVLGTRPNKTTEQYVVIYVEGGIVASVESLATLNAAIATARVMALFNQFDSEQDDVRIFRLKQTKFDEVWSYDPEEHV